MLARFYREPLTLDDQSRASLSARTDMPGQFINLPNSVEHAAVTHYELTGPEDGPVVVLVHGLSTPLFLWNPTVPALVAAGYRVLRYDLFGRGFSDRPRVKSDIALFRGQLLSLLDALDLTAPVDVVGISMGGMIAVDFCDQHPDRVRKLALIDPAGYPMKATLGVILLFLPGIGEALMALNGDKLILAGLPKDFLQPRRYADYYEQYRKQLPYQGFKRSLLSTIRNMPFSGAMEPVYQRVGQQDRPKLLLWGREDRTIPFALHEQVQAALPGVEFHAIDEAAHLPHYEQPAVVNPILVRFLEDGIV
ncbi:alpha/beta fold hydrolase [Chloroflexota bacterium]